MQKNPKPKTEKTQRAWFKDEIKSRLSEGERGREWWERERERGRGEKQNQKCRGEDSDK
jgi:hypothetical protein